MCRIKSPFWFWGGLLSCCLLGYATLVLADTSAENGDRVVSARLKTVVRQYREPAEESILALEQALRDARQLLGEGHYASGMLEQLQKQVDRAETPAVRHRLLREGLTRVQESLAFRPILEAKLPAGYPAPTPLHQIEVKQLPACRLARVEMDRPGRTGENSSFYSLFNHIKRNDIAMTAPVEIEYGERGTTDAARSMAFLYRSTELGTVGEDPRDPHVQVIDVPELTVLSIGCRGEMNDQAVAAAEQKLNQWLQENADRYTQSGPLRKLGYNSPFMPSFLKYFEVLLPVTPVDAEP